MDHYEFPHITDIAQCLKAIEGRPEFVVAERDRHTIINYMMMGSDTFPPVNRYATKLIVGAQPYVYETDMDAAIRRECRGIVFGTDGRVIARRLHKFFNAGEHPEVKVDELDFSKDHVVLEKLDGSMITPIPIGDHIRWGTKMGLTSVGFQAEEFVATRPEYLKFAEHCVHWGITPIFEWCSRKQRIVIDYPKDTLVLLAVRNNVTGEYLAHDHMKTLGKFWKIPVVHGLNGSVEDASEFVDSVMNSEHAALMEGYVVRFGDGHMVKVKTADYVRIHRAKDSILQEKRVIEMIVNEKCDDVLPHLLEHDKEALTKFRDSFWAGIIEIGNECHWLYSKWYKSTGGDKKTFAIESDFNPTYKSVCFSIWGKDPDLSVNNIYGELATRVKKNLGSGTRVDGARWMWGGAKWADYIGAEDGEPL